MACRCKTSCAGAEYLEALGRPMSDLGRAVADILGYVYEGIYHIEDRELRRTKWDAEHYLQIRIAGPMSTFDDDRLTRLVVLAHEMCVRVEVRACGVRHLHLGFQLRSANPDAPSDARHPSLDEARRRIQRSVLIEESGS